MKKKTNLLMLLLLLILPLLQSCGSDGAKKVAEKAVEYQIEGDIASFYDLLSTDDQEAITKDNFIEMYHLPKAQQQLLDIIPEARKEYKASKFKETITGDRALVTYVMTLPNLDEVGRGVLALNDLIEVMQDRNATSLAKLPEGIRFRLQDHVAKNGVPTIEVTNQMDLIREGDDWKVRLNLNNEILQKREIPTPFSR